MHKKCYELLEQNDYDVSYESLFQIDNIQPINRKRISEQSICNNRFNFDYGIADKYIGEYGVFYEYLAYQYAPYLLEDPLENVRNRERILELQISLNKRN